MSTFNQATDRDDHSRLKRQYRLPACRTMSTPGFWVRMHMTRPRRKLNRQLCRFVERGLDPDDLIWPLGSHKPHVYYW